MMERIQNKFLRGIIYFVIGVAIWAGVSLFTLGNSSGLIPASIFWMLVVFYERS